MRVRPGPRQGGTAASLRQSGVMVEDTVFVVGDDPQLYRASGLLVAEQVSTSFCNARSALTTRSGVRQVDVQATSATVTGRYLRIVAEPHGEGAALALAAAPRSSASCTLALPFFDFDFDRLLSRFAFSVSGLPFPVGYQET